MEEAAGLNYLRTGQRADNAFCNQGWRCRQTLTISLVTWLG
jgi:hypothetical protein